MSPTSAGITDHYASTDIAARLLAALRAAQGPDAPITPDALAPLDHFHGRGVAATRELVALLEPRAGERILDIGCGIGGPARWIAARFGCEVTGIDLTAELDLLPRRRGAERRHRDDRPRPHPAGQRARPAVRGCQLRPCLFAGECGDEHRRQAHLLHLRHSAC